MKNYKIKIRHKCMFTNLKNKKQQKMATTQPIAVLHDGTIGDVWAALPVVKEYHRQKGVPIVMYLTSGQRATYYEGATHPTRDGENNMVMLNDATINKMIPLLKSQPYITDAKIHNEEKINIDLNAIRQTFVNQPYHSLSRWYFYVYPDLVCDLSKKYIEVPDTDKDFAKDKIIISRTERYQNPTIDYSFLQPFQDRIIFSGTEMEYRLFKARYYLDDMPLIQTKDFLELAQAIKQSKGLISNQTQIFQIAEGLKTPRAVELCRFAPNVEPIGEQAFEYYAQNALEFYFHTFNGTAKEYLKQQRVMQKVREIEEMQKEGLLKNSPSNKIND